MLELAEEAFDQIAFAIEALAEAGFPFAIEFGRDVRHSALLFDQVTDAVGVIRLVGKNDGAWIEAIKQVICGGAVMCLPGGQAEALRIDDGMDFRCEPASGATETMISIPLFAVAACWCARMEVLSIIWMSPS